jgi:hypothetical protein
MAAICIRPFADLLAFLIFVTNGAFGDDRIWGVRLFRNLHPDVDAVVGAGGSGQGIRLVDTRAASIGMLSRPLAAQERGHCFDCAYQFQSLLRLLQSCSKRSVLPVAPLLSGCPFIPSARYPIMIGRKDERKQGKGNKEKCGGPVPVSRWSLSGTIVALYCLYFVGRTGLRVHLFAQLAPGVPALML